MARRILLVALAASLFLLVSPAGRTTLRMVRSTQELTTVALLKPNEWSLNPLSPNGLFFPPALARWLLLNTSIPYRPCRAPSTECEVSLVAWVGRSLDQGSPERREHALELLRHFITRGQPINQLSQGLTPLHEAVLFRNAQYLEALLHAGADLHVKADEVSKSAAGLTPLEFCLRLEEKRPGEGAALCETLRTAEGVGREAPNSRWRGP